MPPYYSGYDDSTSYGNPFDFDSSGLDTDNEGRYTSNRYDDDDSDFDSMASDDDGATDDGYAHGFGSGRFDNVFSDGYSGSAHGSSFRDGDGYPDYESDYGDGYPDNASDFNDDTDIHQLSSRFAAASFASAAPRSMSRALAQPQSRAGQTPMCIVCGIRPAYNRDGKTYSTCGLTCAAEYQSGGSRVPNGRDPTPDVINILCVVCGKKPAYIKEGKHCFTCGLTCTGVYKTGNFTPLCVICGARPAYRKNGKSYPTCGLTCAGRYEIAKGNGQVQTRDGTSTRTCVICNDRLCFRRGPDIFLTCGMACLKSLCSGGGDRLKCSYCHRKPKLTSSDHCGPTCRSRSRVACLMCRCRPKLGKYHFCGRACKKLAMETAPKILEVPQNHDTWDMVATKFKKAWKPTMGEPVPQIKHVYKIVESSVFLKPYDTYKKKVGNERFCYHGMPRDCQLGNTGRTTLCSSRSCPLCNILKTSFNTNLGSPEGGFGAAIYTSSAANKAYSYRFRRDTSKRGEYNYSQPGGAILLNKVALGRVYNASNFREVTSLPAGYNSVVFDRDNGRLNETIVYHNDAIRPVFLLVF